MQLTWKDVEPQVRAILRDDTSGEDTGRYDQGKLIAWWNHAQVRLATHKPVRRHAVYVASDWQAKPVVAVNVPTRFYNHIGMFVDGNRTKLPRISLFEATFNSAVRGFYLTENELVVTIPKGSVQKLLFFYNAYYMPVEGDTSVLDVPYWAIEACSLYVALIAVTREAMADSRYRKYISSEDAGNPTHNPFIPVAKFLKERFYEIINLHQDDDIEAFK